MRDGAHAGSQLQIQSLQQGRQYHVEDPPVFDLSLIEGQL
jgi:hypothetical protein